MAVWSVLSDVEALSEAFALADELLDCEAVSSLLVTSLTVFFVVEEELAVLDVTFLSSCSTLLW